MTRIGCRRRGQETSREDAEVGQCEVVVAGTMGVVVEQRDRIHRY